MKNKSKTTMIVGGFTLIGMGLGFVFNYLQAFMFIGTGVGLVAAYFIPSTKSQTEHGNIR